MGRFIEGQDRYQQTLLPESLDEFMAEDNAVRVIDAFVGELDLAALGFDGVHAAATGRPSYRPAVLLRGCRRNQLPRAILLSRIRASASQIQAVEIEVLRSWCMTTRRQRSFQACVRSTTQRLGRTTKPLIGSCPNVTGVIELGSKFVERRMRHSGNDLTQREGVLRRQRSEPASSIHLLR